MFESETRDEIFEAIKHTCWSKNGKNLPVYGVPDHLKEYHTSKKDVQESREVIPDVKYRMKEEDIYPENAGSQQKETPMQQQPQGGTANTAGFGFDEIAATNTQMRGEVA